MKKYYTFLFVVLFIFPFFVHAQTPAPAPVKKKGKRPKVGLVLSGGGAKGFAYIGLFKVLKEVGLHIDYVAGTSIGSIMAGFYAAGYDPDTLTAIVRAQDWDKVMSDNVDRKYISLLIKRWETGW
jgi:NTE family protein